MQDDQSATAKRIFAAMDWLEQRLHDDVRLADLARQACYSMYHFERVFADQVGQTPMDYLRRRRLQLAAMRIRHESGPITDIALESGFATSSSFAKAFRQQFGYSARDWRHGAWRPYMDENYHNSLRAAPDLIHEGNAWLASRNYTEPDALPPIHVIKLMAQAFLYRRWIGLAGHTLQRLMDTTLADAELNGLLDGNGHYVWSAQEDFTAVRADLVVNSFGVIPSRKKWPATAPAGFIPGWIPGGEYAAMPFHGDALWRWMHELWLEKQSVYHFDARRPHLEIGRRIGGVHRGHLLLPVRRWPTR